MKIKRHEIAKFTWDLVWPPVVVDETQVGGEGRRFWPLKATATRTLSGAVEAVDGEKPNINHIRRAAKICEGSKNVCVVPKIARRVFLKKTQRANTLSEIKIACPPLNIILFVHWSLRSNLMKDNQGACDEPRGVQEARHSASTGINWKLMSTLCYQNVHPRRLASNLVIFHFLVVGGHPALWRYSQPSLSRVGYTV